MTKNYAFGYGWLVLVWGLVLLAGTRAKAQTPTWQNAVNCSVGANQDAYVQGMVADASGNVYAVGAFRGTVSFGTTTLNSGVGQDGFVVKWSPATGDFVWAQQLGGIYDDVATAVAVNGANVYVTGRFRSPAATFGAMTLATAGFDDFFLTKLTDAGATASFTWAQRVGGFEFESGEALVVSGANVYVAGYYGSATFGTTVLPPSSGTNIFVAKLVDAGPTGSFVWAKAAGGFDHNVARALAISGSSVYVAGFFSRTATFGTTTLTSAGIYDAVVAKLVDAGTTADFVWAQRAGGTGDDQARALALHQGQVYVAGSFEGSAATFGPTTLASAGQADGFVAKLTDTGATSSFGWVQRMGGARADFANALTSVGPHMCVAGTFASLTASFGATTLAMGLPNAIDLFVARLTDMGSTGTVAWAQRAGGRGYTSCLAVAVAPSGVVYVGAGMPPPASFGAWPVFGLPDSMVAALGSLTDATLTAATPATPLVGLAILPNPAHARATVQLPALAGTATATLTLLDALGRAVRTQTAAIGTRTELNLRGLAPGLYAVRLVAGATIATQRLIIE